MTSIHMSTRPSQVDIKHRRSNMRRTNSHSRRGTTRPRPTRSHTIANQINGRQPIRSRHRSITPRHRMTRNRSRTIRPPSITLLNRDRSAASSRQHNTSHNSSNPMSTNSASDQANKNSNNNNLLLHRNRKPRLNTAIPHITYLDLPAVTPPSTQA